MQPQKLIENPVLSPALVAKELHIAESEVADTLGLELEKGALAIQVQLLRQMLEILGRVEAATGSVDAAYSWFRAESLPGFGGAKPVQLVLQHKADHVHAYLDQIMAGGYA